MRFFLLCLLGMIISHTANATLPKVKAGKIEQFERFESKYVPTRTVQVWLPPGYSKTKTYPVLYMHDGQMLFDAATTWNKQEWKVDEIASRLIQSKQVEPFIVVGIFNGDKDRHSEYFPQKPFNSLSTDKQTEYYGLHRDPNTKLFSQTVYSDNYLKFLVNEVIPFIEKYYSVSTNREDRFLMGSSMGGLISMYGLLEYPNVFYGAACLSTHWPGVFASEDNPVPQAFIDYMASSLPEVGQHKIYFDYGTETLDAMYPPLQQNVDKLMTEKGYGTPYWRTQRFDGAAHTENDWAKRLHVPLLFLMGNKS